MGWDALLWRTAEGSGGTLLDLPKEDGPKKIAWRAVNSLYAGWETLLSGSEPIAGSKQDAWHSAWNMTEGDISQPLSWVKGMPLDPAEATSSVLQHLPGPARLRRHLWCRGPRLRPVATPLGPRPLDRPHHAAHPPRRHRTARPERPPKIPDPTDLQVYHGERLDLDQVDLGAYLRSVAKQKKLAQPVVLHLHGTGHRKFTPVRVENVNLFLYFEPPAAGAEPLVLEPDATVAPDGNALFEVSNGNLWIIGADVRCPDFRTALLPRYMVMVTEGSLYLTATRLQGPLAHAASELLRADPGRGDRQLERGTTHSASINQCVLLSGGIVLDLARAGLRADVRQSLVVGTDRAVAIQPDVLGKEAPTGRRTSTSSSPRGTPPLPRTRRCFPFRNWSRKRDRRRWSPTRFSFRRRIALPQPVRREGRQAGAGGRAGLSGRALRHGVLCWQAEGNVYDRRLLAFAAVADGDGKPVLPNKSQTYAIVGAHSGARRKQSRSSTCP